MDPQLLLFRRHYFQLVEPDFLAWPPKQLLRDPNAQSWLSRKCFDGDYNDRLPSKRYRFRVLKILVKKIEQAIEDPEKDVGIFCSLTMRRPASKPIYFAFVSLFPSDRLIARRKSRMSSCRTSLR